MNNNKQNSTRYFFVTLNGEREKKITIAHTQL